MSRSDEEGFHPHPGDPWHPGWVGEDDEDIDPFAASPEKPATGRRPKKRGRFGRRKGEQEPEAPETFEADGGDLPEPSGWEAYDDDQMAADLESVAPDTGPSWTDEGGSSVAFESAFTVGGDVGSDEAGLDDIPGGPSAGMAPAGDPDTWLGGAVPGVPGEDGLDLGLDTPDPGPSGRGDLDLSMLGLTEEPPAPAEEPTLLLDEVFLPDPPDLTGLADTAERALPEWDDDDPDDESIPHLDDLLPRIGGPDAATDDLDAGMLEIPEAAGVDDLTKAADDAAAALRSRTSEVRTEQALEMMAGELGATEVDAAPEPPEVPMPPPQATQDTLLSAGLDLPEEEAAAADPGYTPESDEPEADGIGFPFESATVDDRREPAPIAPVEAVDAALMALATEPLSGADPDALDALRSIDEDEDVDDWQAYAEGEPIAGDWLPEVASAGEVLGDLDPPLLPTAGVDDFYDEPADFAEEPAPKRGMFGRRRARKEAASDMEVDAWPESDDQAPGAHLAGDAPGEMGGEAWDRDPLVPMAPAEDLPLEEAEEEDWDDAIAGDAEADAFFAEESPQRRMFGGQRQTDEIEPVAADDPMVAETAGPVVEAGGWDAPGSPVSEEPVDHDPGAVDDDGPERDAAWDDEQPLSGMPLLDEGHDRLEVMPIGEIAPPEPPEATAYPAPEWEAEEQYPVPAADDAPLPVIDPAAPSGGLQPPAPPADPVEQEYGEWRGEGSSVPASWFADVDEDELVVEDMRPVDSEGPAPLLEAGGMFDVDDILDPLGDELVPPVADGARDEAPPAPAPEPPPLPEPPDLFQGARRDPPAHPADGTPDLLSTATSLFPEPDDDPSPDETIGGDAGFRAGPLLLPGGGAEAWDAPPLVPAEVQEWDDEAGQETSVAPHPAPPFDPTAEVYDVVEDDIDRAPLPTPPAIDPDAPVAWSDDIYSGAVTMEHRGLAEAIARASTEDTELQALSAAMPGLASGVVGFEDVEDLGTDEVYIPPVRSDLGARVLTGLILVSLLFGSLWVSGGALAGFIGVMLMIGLTEYYTTLRHKGYTPLVIFGYLGAIGCLAGAWVWGPIAVPAAILATVGIVFFFYAFAPRRRDALTNGALTIMGTVWVAGTVAFAMPIIASENYRVLVFALVAVTVAMDVGAYGFGRAWGSAQLAPVLSPNKSIEGLAGGIVLAIGVSIAIGFFLDPFDIRSGAALGLVAAVFAPLGDLAESMFKRSLGVKDMGAILPGHGGILDRVDAFLFVIPAVWILYSVLGYLT